MIDVVLTFLRHVSHSKHSVIRRNRCYISYEMDRDFPLPSHDLQEPSMDPESDPTCGIVFVDSLQIAHDATDRLQLGGIELNPST